MLLAVAFVAVAGRLTWLQVVAPEEYGRLGEAQRLRSIPLPGERGSIFDRNGHDLALSVRQHTVWADPRLVTDPMLEAAALAPLLGVPEDELRRRLTQDGAFVYLARQVPDDVAERVAALELDGVELLEESKRFTPAGDLAASVIGAVDVDNNGLSGLELLFDETLSGTAGEMLLELGADGSTIAAGEREVRPAARGSDLVLTLDRGLQHHAERLLVEQVARTGADGALALVMRPGTGEILAMANVRAGDKGQPPRPARQNMAVNTVFEPGSVNKVITLAGALEEGLYRPDDVLEVPDRLKVSVHTFSDHDRHPTVPMTVNDILTTSSNIGTIMIAQALGAERVDGYLRRFGFGSPTGLGFPGESDGLVLPLDEWTGTSIGSMPIGQGVAVTALQMLLAYNAVANGGVFVAPKMVNAVVDADGSERRTPPPERRRVISSSSADAMNRMLVGVVEEGTGTGARIDGYTVAGKTGTARKPAKNFRGYESGAYVSTFAGYVPAENPELSVIVVLDEPRNGYYGGLVSAPVFAELAQYALRVLRVPPAPVDEPPVEPPPSTLDPSVRPLD